MRYSFSLLIMLVMLVVILGGTLFNPLVVLEGFDPNTEINYANMNSPDYSHTVDLPLTNTESCKNMCGPNAKCAITGEQCTSDIDCFGCNPGPKQVSAAQSDETIMPYDATGKLGQNQGLQYSSLTTGYANHGMDFAEVYPNSKNAQISKPYLGLNLWAQSFNKGLELHNMTQAAADNYGSAGKEFNIVNSFEKMNYYENRYPTTISSAGEFYNTTPPAANVSWIK